MSIYWLTLRDLEYVVRVAELSHFSKAAKACHVSQPALSAQIRKIEGLLEVSLFERSNRKVSITRAGEAVVAQARVVLDEAKKIGELSQKHLEPLSGKLRLGAIASLGPYYLPHFLGPVRKQFPKLELYLKEGLTNGLLADLKDGRLDMILASPTFDEAGFKVLPLFFEPFLLAAPKGHPLLKKSILRSADLDAGQMVLLEDGHCLKDQTVDFCAPSRRGEGVGRHFHATSLETLRHLVASGLGYTLIPALAERADLDFGRLVQYRKFDGKPVGRVVAIVCRENFGRMQDVEGLVSFIRGHLPDGVTA